ncbi:MAG: polysaccharide biosynthesis tyrosine autokinase [Pseudomonadota bacterium]|nr:polysaccharide biosynthesis tyrosine autokinase [Pseudomonadota bacterium]
MSNTAVEVIDLTYYWQIIRRHGKKIIALSAVVGLVAALVSLAMTPVFRGKSTLLIESQEAKVLSIEEVYGLPSASSEYLLTQFEILKSRELARRVVIDLGLVDNPEFNPYHELNKKSFSLKGILFGEGEEPAKEEVLSATTDRFWKSVTIEPIRKTQLVKLSVDSESPEIAMKGANALADAYIESQLEAKIGLTQKASGWLSGRLGGLKERLDESEKKLQDYREQNNIVDVAGVSTLVAKEIDQITQRLVEARAKRIELESAYNQLHNLEDKSYESLSSLPNIINNPLVVRLRESETSSELKVSELSKRYGPLHPRMIAAQSDLEAVRDSVHNQMGRIANSIENDFNVARSKESSLQSALEDAKSRARLINRTEFQLNEYQREVDANRDLYEAFFTRIRETSATGDLQTANARVIDPAVLPKSPVKPNNKLIVLLALIGSAMFGIVLAFLLDVLNATIKNADDVDRKLGVSLLGLLPLISFSTKEKKAAATEETDRLVRAFAENKDSGFSEAFRTLRTSLTLAGLEHPANVVLITSSVPGEGKTTTSANLAEAFGQMEKTLLIDADMRRPTVARKLGLTVGSMGLSSAVAYPDTLDECIHSVPELGIDVIPSGPVPPNPLELLASKNFRHLLESLKTRYQRIIIDSAPMHAVSDALYLSTLTDGVVYVVKADATKDKSVNAGIQRLTESNARVLGVVLNQVNVEKEARYGGHYTHYSGAYAYSSDK